MSAQVPNKYILHTQVSSIYIIHKILAINLECTPVAFLDPSHTPHSYILPTQPNHLFISTHTHTPTHKYTLKTHTYIYKGQDNLITKGILYTYKKYNLSIHIYTYMNASSIAVWPSQRIRGSRERRRKRQWLASTHTYLHTHIHSHIIEIAAEATATAVVAQAEHIQHTECMYYMDGQRIHTSVQFISSQRPAKL